MPVASVNTVIAVPLALGAGGCFALATVLQQQAARSAPPSQSLHLGLLANLAHRPVWVTGVALGVLSVVLQGFALHFGPLALVQPLIVSDLLFALVISSRLRRARPRNADYAGAAAIAVGLSVFIVTADPSPGVSVPPLQSWIPVLLGTGVILALVLLAAGRTRGALRTSILGAGAGAMFGLMSALLKTVTALVATGLGEALTSWETYALAVAAISGFLLAQSAFQAGALAVSLPLIDVLEPVTATVIGYTAFGESVSVSTGRLAAQVVGAVLVVGGIVRLDRSPLVREARG